MVARNNLNPIPERFFEYVAYEKLRDLLLLAREDHMLN